MTPPPDYQPDASAPETASTKPSSPAPAKPLIPTPAAPSVAPAPPAAAARRPDIGRFPISDAARAFRRRHFPDATVADWQDWRWQMRHRFRNAAELSTFLDLSADERRALEQPGRPFPVAVTPYTASQLHPTDPADPMRRLYLPVPEEFDMGPGEYNDPLAEDVHSPVPGLVHRYPDRVLFLVTDQCPVYCRYCTRSRLVGGNAEFELTRRQWQKAIDYIAATPVVRDVLISGGDPLALADQKLEWLLERLRPIKHLEMIRIGTKVPVVLPQRITRSFTRMLRRFHPLYMSIHTSHPAELSVEAAEACGRLADAGIPLGSQTVLLKGVNDNESTIRELMHGCLKMRVRPYYLLQCDPIQGSAHFRTSLSDGIRLIKSLRGHTTGYAVPHYIVDVPNGGGKISLDPSYLTGREDEDWLIRNFTGKDGFRYHDPEGTATLSLNPAPSATPLSAPATDAQN